MLAEGILWPGHCAILTDRHGVSLLGAGLGSAVDAEPNRTGTQRREPVGAVFFYPLPFAGPTVKLSGIVLPVRVRIMLAIYAGGVHWPTGTNHSAATHPGRDIGQRP